MARTEVRKECPSCGLGVPLEAKVCEFCGWDFEEEDEWISQIEKLEQELITEKSKFDDTSVDKMIRSSLHSSTGEKPSGGEETPEAIPVIVKKKKLAAKGSVQVRIARPLGEDLLAEEKALEEEERPAPKPAPAVSKPKSVSIKVDVSKIPPPPEEFDLEEELAAREKEEIEKEKVAEEAEDEGATIEAAPMKEPAEAASTAPATRTRRVRRVVSHPTGAPGASPVKAAASPAASSPKPAPTKVAPAKAAPVKPKPPAAAPAKAAPAKPAPAKAAPEKEEKKGLFGRMFGGEKEEKPEAKPAPTKVTPAKQTAPAKPQSKMFQCPLCNAMVREEDKACPNCGAEFE
jgi:RNA polymerase subunit RPABC4/transcription elongation factor Spt4